MSAIDDKPSSYDRDTTAVLHAASALSGFYRRKTLLCETLLLTLLQDEAIRARWPGGASAAEASLEQAIWTLPDEPDAGGAWSPRARRALHAAWDRRRNRARTKVVRADLLSGIMGASGLAAEVIRAAALDLRAFEAEDPPIAGGDLSLDPAPTGEAAPRLYQVVLENDPETRMDAVVELLREHLGLAQPRAMLAMFRVHFRGSEVVATLPAKEAWPAIERCRDAACDNSPRLRFRLIAAEAGAQR